MRREDIEQRLALAQMHRTWLIEEIIAASARWVGKNYDQDKCEFLLSKFDDSEDFEPWFELRLPDGTQLRVSVEIRAM